MARWKSRGLRRKIRKHNLTLSTTINFIHKKERHNIAPFFYEKNTKKIEKLFVLFVKNNSNLIGYFKILSNCLQIFCEMAAWFTQIDADLAIAMMGKYPKLSCKVALTGGAHSLSFTKPEVKKDIAEVKKDIVEEKVQVGQIVNGHGWYRHTCTIHGTADIRIDDNDTSEGYTVECGFCKAHKHCPECLCDLDSF